MKVIYLKLINIAGLYVGSNINKLEIDFSKSINKIIAIISPNASGKSCLLSSISPFANVTSIDDRSSLSYIIPDKSGYKEIHYHDDEIGDIVIKHYYKPSGKSHTVKSYFSINGEELNDNGNVKSFISLVEIHMGLTQDMMRLIRLGSNVNSIISLTPAARKEYIGKLINEIDIYLQIYRHITDKIKVSKSLIATNDTNLYNCHISDIIIEEESLKDLGKNIKKLEKDKDKTIAELGKLESLIKSNDVNDLRRRQREAQSSLEEYNKVYSMMKDGNLLGTTVDTLISRRSNTVSKKIDIQSKINSYRMSIDSSLKSIERLEVSIKRITSNNDIKTLTESITSLRRSISETSAIVKNLIFPTGVSSESIMSIINKLSSFNTIGQTIHSFGDKPFNVYMKLIESRVPIDKWLKEQANKIRAGFKESDLKMIFDIVFEEYNIITPNCEYEFMECPYYRLAEVIDKTQKDIDDHFDPETLRYIQIISNNIDIMMNEIDSFKSIKLPDRLKDSLKESNILERFSNKLSFFDISIFHEYLTLIRAKEVYDVDVNRLAQYEHQLSIYKNSGVDGQIQEIKEFEENIKFYRNNVDTLSRQISEIDDELKLIDSQISLVSRYNEISKYKDMFESTLQSTTKILGPLEKAEQERMRLQYELDQQTSRLESTRNQQKLLDRRITEYKRLVEEGERLSKEFKDLKVIQSSVNTKGGIPVIYMKRYLGRIRNLANNLLSIIYGDNFKLGKFHITDDTFEIPYIKHGTKISDVKYSSQSELSMSTIAISFALSNNSSGKYNIPLLDEVDSGLDESNRLSFLKMFNLQMNALKAEQAFIISQNLSQMVNVPMDVIMLGDTGSHISKLQNVIYERRQ